MNADTMVQKDGSLLLKASSTLVTSRPRVQKKSRLHGSEPEENRAFYVVFEEGFEICIDNPVSAKFSYYATSTMKGIAHLQ